MRGFVTHRFLFPVFTVSAGNAWHNDPLLHMNTKINGLQIMSLALLTQSHVFSFVQGSHHTNLPTSRITAMFNTTVRDWSKSMGGGGGPEQRGGGSWGFEPCARGGSCNFQLPLGGGSPYFLLTTNETVDYSCYIKHSQLELLLK